MDTYSPQRAEWNEVREMKLTEENKPHIFRDSSNVGRFVLQEKLFMASNVFKYAHGGDKKDFPPKTNSIIHPKKIGELNEAKIFQSKELMLDQRTKKN